MAEAVPIPEPPGLPLLGNLGEFSANPIDDVVRLANTYGKTILDLWDTCISIGCPSFSLPATSTPICLILFAPLSTCQYVQVSALPVPRIYYRYPPIDVSPYLPTYVPILHEQLQLHM